MDPLTHLLDHPRAQNVFTLRVVMSDPWSIDVRDGSALTIMAVTSGTAWLVTDHSTVRLLPGDIALVRGPDPYQLGTSPGMSPIAVIHPGQVCRTPDGADLQLEMGRGIRTWGNDAAGPHSLVVGSYESASEIGRLVADALPGVAHLPAALVDGGLLELITREIAIDGVAQSSLLDRLMDVLLITAVRSWLETHPQRTPGWISGSCDPAVGGALEAIHENPQRPWTIADLARQSNVSRATLAARFREQVGLPPLAYLTRWRLTLASDLLADPQLTLAAIARSVGYGSPFTFSTAFKKQFGVSPTRYRQNKYAPSRGRVLST